MKQAKRKIKLSAIPDHSNMGFATAKDEVNFTEQKGPQHLGAEMQVTTKTFMALKKALKRAIADRHPDSTTYFVLKSGDQSGAGSAEYYLVFNNRDGTENRILYTLVREGKTYFINVGGNPSCLISGGNDIPTLVTDTHYEFIGKYNGPTMTFKYMNRVMYSVLDDLLEDYDFVWEGSDKRNLINGKINIRSYQLAWYSGDLGESRAKVQRFIRLLYCGTSANLDKVENLCRSLNIVANMHNNHAGNVTIEAKSSTNRSFMLTLYAKDNHPNYDGNNEERVNQLIRWDCSLYHAFLKNNGILTIDKLEDKYIETCEEGGYDSGFVLYLSKKIRDKIKFDYLMSMNNVVFEKGINALQRIEGKYERLLADYWLDFNNEPLESNKDYVALFKLKEGSEPRISEAKKNLLKLGIDVDISRAFHLDMLDQRARAHQSYEEKDAGYRDTNQAPTIRQLKERDFAMSVEVKNAVASGGISRIRRFTPMKVKPHEFWVLQGFKQ